MWTFDGIFQPDLTARIDGDIARGHWILWRVRRKVVFVEVTIGLWVEVLWKSADVNMRDDGDFNASKLDHLDGERMEKGWMGYRLKRSKDLMMNTEIGVLKLVFRYHPTGRRNSEGGSGNGKHKMPLVHLEGGSALSSSLNHLR